MLFSTINTKAKLYTLDGKAVDPESSLYERMYYGLGDRYYVDLNNNVVYDGFTEDCDREYWLANNETNKPVAKLRFEPTARMNHNETALHNEVVKNADTIVDCVL